MAKPVAKAVLVTNSVKKTLLVEWKLTKIPLGTKNVTYSSSTSSTTNHHHLFQHPHGYHHYSINHYPNSQSKPLKMKNRTYPMVVGGGNKAHW